MLLIFIVDTEEKTVTKIEGAEYVATDGKVTEQAHLELGKQVLIGIRFKSDEEVAATYQGVQTA